MEKFDSISHFLQSGDFDYRIYDMGRKVWEISRCFFEEVENQRRLFPYPFQQKASIALLFWPRREQKEATIWFLQFPIDEFGFLQQAARDTFLIDLLEQTGKNIQAKQKGGKAQDSFVESPFSFKPREDRLAMFHALATGVLGLSASSYYQYARDYLKPKSQGGLGYDQWQFLGVQGVCDVVSRLQQDDNARLLACAVGEMPLTPLNSYAQALENVEIPEVLFTQVQNRLRVEITKKEADSQIVASLIRAVSGYGDKTKRLILFSEVLRSKLASEVEVVAAISARSWGDLHDDNFRFLFLQVMVTHQQMVFNAIVLDLIQIPGMRDLILGALRDAERSPELTKKYEGFMKDAQA